MSDPEQSYPRLSARTQRFTLGTPRGFTIAPDGSRVVFLRSSSGTDRAHALWVLDLPEGRERLVVDPRSLLGDDPEELTPQERARRERLREGGAGIVAYATDTAVRTASFALSGQVWVAGLVSGGATRVTGAEDAVDPRVDPTGTRVAYAAAGSLSVAELASPAEPRVLVAPESETQAWGLAEFVAAEEMDRSRGFWWAPDGRSLLVERYDEAPVGAWWIGDPGEPARAPQPHRYPAAGTANADVTLWHVSLDGTRREVPWDHAVFPYLARVSWTADGPPLLHVQTRDQRRTAVLAVDLGGEAGGTGAPATRMLDEQVDERWVDLVPGVPAWLPGGRLLTTADDADTRRLCVDGVPVSPVGLQVRAVLDVLADGVLATVSREPTEVELVRIGTDGTVEAAGPAGGVSVGRAAGHVTVVAGQSLDVPGTSTEVRHPGGPAVRIPSLALTPPVRPHVRLLRAGPRELRTVVVFPQGHEPGSGPLPVLMDPYGGPHAQRVLATQRAYWEPQWLADQGFAVVIADGRGTPARGPAWEREVYRELADVTLADQVDALRYAAEAYPDLDLSRVAIRGWSYGGYLAALAVLRRPDVFAAAIAGAPVTDWALYDTHYTERYLGMPQDEPDTYRRNSLIDDAPSLTRPLLIIHGLADDNVVAAHTVRLSAALLAAGRPHRVLPLSGVTHMTPQEVVAENLLNLQVAFLHESLPPSTSTIG